MVLKLKITFRMKNRKSINKYTAIFLLLLLFPLAGCLQKNDTASEQPPVSGIILVDDEEYEMRTEEYKFKGKNARISSKDTVLPNQLADQIEPIKTEKNTQMELLIDKNPELTAYLWNEEELLQEITIKDNHIMAPSTSGRYIYEIRSKWYNGEASFIFIIEIY